jgi:streptogramin lyase
MRTLRSASRLALASACLEIAVAQPNRTYTTSADFSVGTLINTNLSVPNTVRVNPLANTSTFPFVNVAASGRGTIIRIDANTGAILGEYRTAPDGFPTNPSRTTVDLFGNVWSGNRDQNNPASTVKVGLVVGGTRTDQFGNPDPAGEYLKGPFQYNNCADRNLDGLIRTSRGANNVLPWPNITDGAGGSPALVEDAFDECILIFQRMSGDQSRHVSVDKLNDVWVGPYPFTPQTFHKFNGSNGIEIGNFSAAALGCGGYGGFIDRNGVLWSASISQNFLLRWNTNTSTGTCIVVPQAYGLGVDTNGNVWSATWCDSRIAKLNPAGVMFPGFPKVHGSGCSRGVVVTPNNNHVWIASSQNNRVIHLDNDGNLIKNIPVGSEPTGVTLDTNGKIWVTNYSSWNVMRIDPNIADGTVDLTVALPTNAYPYNYSDMTGAVAIGVTNPRGAWRVVQDSGSPTNNWSGIMINTEPAASVPGGSRILVEARAAANEAALGAAQFVPVIDATTPGPKSGALALTGRFLEVRATLFPNAANVSPVLSDLRVSSIAGPVQACDVDANGQIDFRDIQAIFNARNTPATGPNDPRDADRDGVITIADARKCTLSCTKPQCVQ